jgi:hypothetical protein
MELLEHVTDFEKCSTIKSQILADFIVEWIELGFAIEGPIPESPWLVYCNGAWGAVGARVAAILISPLGIKLCYVARLQFNNEADKCTNNIAEYEAILLELRKLRAIRGPKMHPPQRPQSSRWVDQKRVHCQGTDPRKIPNPHQKNGEPLQGFNRGINRAIQKHRS